MRQILLVAILYVGLKYSLQLKSSTPPVEERLKILKWQLKEEIEEKQNGFSLIPPDPDDDFDILVTKKTAALRNRHGLITPISRHKKKKIRTRTTEITTTKATTEATIDKQKMLRDATDNTTDSSDNSTENLEIQLRMKQLKNKAQKWAKHLKKYDTPLEIFYRRGSKQAITEAEIRQRHILHCADMLRPIMMGLKKNITLKVYGEQTVNRLIQLLSYGGHGPSNDEIRSILLQINNMQIRFFQWDVKSLKKLFDFLMNGQRPSFRNLKSGIKRLLLTVWKMNLKNTEQLVKQARMFRPPCVSTSEGSTRTSRGTRYTTPSKPKSTCAPKDKKCLGYGQSEEEDDN